MNKGTTKLLIKIFDGSSAKWVHLCYVDSELFKEFSAKVTDTLNTSIQSWAKEDFGEALYIGSIKDLEKLRLLISKYSKEVYPDLFKESRTDRQGWVRVWITSHMRKELEQHGRTESH